MKEVLSKYIKISFIIKVIFIDGILSTVASTTASPSSLSTEVSDTTQTLENILSFLELQPDDDISELKQFDLQKMATTRDIALSMELQGLRPTT